MACRKIIVASLFLAGCSSSPPTQTENNAAIEAILHPRVLQRHLAHDVKESGPDMQSTYSGFLDDGRVFVATQKNDEGTCMVTTPEDAQWERTKLYIKGTVEPIFLVQYDDSQGGSYWEISQDTRAADINFVPPPSKEALVQETCEVSVIFH